ncbi:protein kinase domain-containing protein, partial [Streptomyces parvus]|uniref:protein kinase domain-containing protein n=1 Tax=Streptomyces parvus TaxID=66428 RepID=UPI0035D8C4CD
PPTSIQDSMEKQMRADRDKRAAILTAEGIRQAAILRAEGEQRAAELRAESELKIERMRRTAEAEDAAASPHGPGRSPAVPHQAPLSPATARHEPLRRSDPREIGRYRLVARLGEGGMGTVYLGMSPGGRRVAVKVVRAELASDPSFQRRFAREVEAVRRVGGFHTAPVVDAGPDAERPWLVTEYIPGPSLADVLRTHGPLPARTVRTLALGIAEALEGIHACEIIHRDLKPGNIVVAESGPRVIDFGIARAADGTALTRTDFVVGTQGFLAPEQLSGGPLTAAVDAYAFGMVLCHSCGAAPSPQGNVFDRASQLLPGDLVELVRDCLRLDPGRRPTAEEMLRQIGDEHSGGSGNDRGAAPEGWLPPAVRTLVNLHQAPTVTAPEQ